MTWIDNQKAYHMVLQTGTIECIIMYKISDKIIKIITNHPENWR